VAILIRPNLALPLAFEKCGLPPFAAKKGGHHLFRLALAMAPALAVLLALNASRYGSPWSTGYGSTDALFTRAHVYANLLRYPRWLIETHTPFVLAPGAPWVLRRDPARARLAVASLAAVALLAATYLAYTVFDDWRYIRFLLPAIPILIALSVTVMRRMLAWLPDAAARAMLAMLVVSASLWYVQVARTRHAMDLQARSRPDVHRQSECRTRAGLLVHADERERDGRRRGPQRRCRRGSRRE
jgi:hypothetical protein